MYALADRLFDFRHRFVIVVGETCSALECASLGSAMSIVVCNRVAQQTVEPGDHALVLANRVALFHSSEECCLEDVFRVGGILYPPLQEGPELPVILHKRRDYFWARIRHTHS